MGGFVMLGVAAVALVVGLVSLAGGGESTPSPSSTVSSVPPAPPPSSAAPLAAPPPVAPPPVAPPPPAAPPAAAPSSAPVTTPTPPKDGLAEPAPSAQQLPGAGLPPADGGAAAGRAPVVPHQPKRVVHAPVRVYNNSTVRDQAQRVASDLRESGWQVTEVGNYPYGAIATSTVYYRPGTQEQAAAESLANEFGLRAAPRFGGIANASPGLIVIVTGDYQRR
jgi:hypothetical protein